MPYAPGSPTLRNNVVIGSTIDGKYYIRKLLGEGAMGSVYEAEHTATGRRCAVKVISSQELTRDPKVVQRFEREARAAGSIDTQHITQVLDAGVAREANLPFLAMEFLAGEDLHRVLTRTGPLAPDVALRIAAQGCIGLQKAHEVGVVHRDIKPHNLFLARRDEGEVIVKLLDFGIAKFKTDQTGEAERVDLTRTGSLVGSPLYMSPEQAVGQREIDHRTDLWSLGVVLYQVLSGRTPFHHLKTVGELILAICSFPIPPLQDFAPWVPPELASIVHRCLQQDPARRFQTAQEMMGTLRPLLPQGWSLREDMLVPMTAAQRVHATPSAGVAIPQPTQSSPNAALPSSPSFGNLQPPHGELRAPMASAPSFGPVPALQTGPRAALASSPSFGSGPYPAVGASALGSGGYPAVPPASTQGGLAASSSGRNARLGRSAMTAGLFIGGTGLALAVGLGAYAVHRFSAKSEAIPAARPSEVAVASSSAQTLERASVQAPAVTAAHQDSPPAESAQRRVRVVIYPTDALVELEGKRTETREGILEISGVPGSVFKVRVFKGPIEKFADVVVTEGGAIPPKVELTPAPRQGPAAAGSNTSAPPATRGVTSREIKRETNEFRR